MPTLNELHEALAEDGLTLDSIERLRSLAHSLFLEEPSVPTFVAWALFRGMSYDFDDPQAVPSSDIEPFVQDLLPALKRWTQSGESFNDVDSISRIVTTFHACQTSSGPK